MPHLLLRLPVHSPHNLSANTCACPYDFGILKKKAQFLSNARVSLSRDMSPSVALACPLATIYPCGALPVVSEGDTRSDADLHLELRNDSPKEPVLNKEFHLDAYSALDSKETQRRRKIGLANKGRLPWNKGRKHSIETRERIKQRTIEAMKDPKVRKKLSEWPHVHSDQSKSRIRYSLKQIWAERLKQKLLKEKLYVMWAESIAVEAKKGGTDQQELEWDSYEKLKAELAIQHLRRAADRSKKKEMAKKNAAAAALAKAEKMVRLVQKRKEQEQIAKTRPENNRLTCKKSSEEVGESAAVQGLKLRARLKKIQKKKRKSRQIHGQENNVHIQPAPEKLDLDFIHRERIQRKVSLADQIRAAKNRRAESIERAFAITSKKR